MQGFEPPIKDVRFISRFAELNLISIQIYSGRAASESRLQHMPSQPPSTTSPPHIGAVLTQQPVQSQQIIPEVVPMRRGRPPTISQGSPSKPSSSPAPITTSDPFAALDGKPQAGSDDLSNRFPSLDQFSLLHDGGKFDFDSAPQPRDLDQRVTEKLADDAFNHPTTSRDKSVSKSRSVSRAQAIISNTPELQSVTAPTLGTQPTTVQSQASYVSQGTMTSPTPPPAQPSILVAPSSRLLVSDHGRSTSLPRHAKPQHSLDEKKTPESPLLSPHKQNLSSRPSLEGGRPSTEAMIRSRSHNSKPRPTSTYLESNIDFLREKEREKDMREARVASERRPSHPSLDVAPPVSSTEETNIESNVEFLRSIEDANAESKSGRRTSGSHKSKRSSLTSLSGTKNLLSGKFGDAFKRFEGHTSTPSPPGPRTPSPLNDMDRRELTPIAGSEATDGRSDDGNVLLEDMEGMAPEQRREIERRRLSMEEKRVANAGAEYRRRIADRPPKSIGGVSRAASIQNKVRHLLDETQASSPPKKLVDGYGRYAASASAPTPRISQFTPPPQPMMPPSAVNTNPYMKPQVGQKPPLGAAETLNYTKPRGQQTATSPPKAGIMASRPSAPPKPIHLNSTATGPAGSMNRPASPKKPSSLAAQPKPPAIQPHPEMSIAERDEYIRDFSRRFPSLGETEGGSQSLR